MSQKPFFCWKIPQTLTQFQGQSVEQGRLYQHQIWDEDVWHIWWCNWWVGIKTWMTYWPKPGARKIEKGLKIVILGTTKTSKEVAYYIIPVQIRWSNFVKIVTTLSRGLDMSKVTKICFQRPSLALPDLTICQIIRVKPTGFWKAKKKLGSSGTECFQE